MPAANTAPAGAELAALVTPARLAEFFAPGSIAVVGASDTSGWARFLLASATTAGFSGPLIPVHRRHKTVFGRPAAASLREVGEQVDLAFIMVPLEAVEEVLEDAAAAGIRGAVVLASGYREVGEDGTALQDRLLAKAAGHGITLLGPNCLGFLNAHARTAPFALTIPPPLVAGPVGVALQSGALASVLLSFARAHAIGVSTLTSLGNEAMIATADVVDYLVEDDHTKVICLFLEAISDPFAFAAAARRADQAGKPIVALKAGASQAGIAAALAHTGSIAGDDAVVDAALRQLNVIRVGSIEELLTTSAVLGYTRWPRGRRMGAVTTSGGACDLIADRASGEGIEIPAFAEQTAIGIAEHLPPFAEARNPLDVTGYFLANQRTSLLTPADSALDLAVDDPGLDFVLFSGLNLPDARPPDAMASALEARAAWLAERIASAPIPVIPIASTCVNLSDYGREVLAAHGLHLLGGIDLGVRAIGNALRWLDGRGRTGLALSSVPASPVQAAGTWGEDDSRALLAAFGVPLVPSVRVNAVEAAICAASRFGFPVAVKISSSAIAHKSDLGAVALGLDDAAGVAAAYEKVVRAAGEHPIDGVAVAPMRTGGVELLAGVTVDATFGPVLAVGLGGVWVEVLRDVSLRVLPVDRAEVLRMLGELRGLQLLTGARGSAAADLDALAGVIAAVGDAALSLRDSLVSLEVNPLWVKGRQIEALDVLVITKELTS
ncbi:MAG TPA: acetate--CoA ligase family protein [Streptosporangiaceae bacterium]|nr:acetate--CoA ligase family protein [Streptosporangiaceae bacterium]